MQRALLRLGGLRPVLRPILSRRFLSNETSDTPLDRRATGHTEPVSFIEKAKILGANALLGKFTHKNGCMEGLTVTRVGEGQVQCKLPVADDVANFYGTLHGGAIATLVDIVGTMAILSTDPAKPGVSVDMNITYIAAAKKGETVLIEGRALKVGGKLGFSEVDIRRESDGALLATGRHTKAFR